MKKLGIVMVVLVVMGLLAYNKISPNGLKGIYERITAPKEEPKENEPPPKVQEEKEETLHIGTERYRYTDEQALKEQLGTTEVEEKLMEELYKAYTPTKGNKEAEQKVRAKQAEYQLVGIKKERKDVEEEIYRAIGIRNMIEDTIGVTETLRQQYAGKKTTYKVYTYQESVRNYKKEIVTEKIKKSVQQIKRYHKQKKIDPEDTVRTYTTAQIENTPLEEYILTKKQGEVGLRYNRAKQYVTYYYIADKQEQLDYSDTEIAEIELKKHLQGLYHIVKYRRLVEMLQERGSKFNVPKTYLEAVNQKEERVIQNREEDIAYNVLLDIENTYRMLYQLENGGGTPNVQQ